MFEHGKQRGASFAEALLAAHLPAKSEDQVEGLLGLRLPDGSPVSVKVDTQFYFICAVVNAHAAH
jgi:hypothetical protein